MGAEWVVPPGLECGNLKHRTAAKRRKHGLHDAHCPNTGDTEAYQFNGGVILMDLARMRARNFGEAFVASVIDGARVTGFKQARWGEQDYLNNFYRLYPGALAALPCGCNYQYSGARREVKCPGAPVYLAHGWWVSACW